MYSPQGNTSASISLAQKFKQAVEKKYLQRLQRLRGVNSDLPSNEDFGLVKYNVFVLDATPDEMHVHLEHLVSRIEDMSIPHSHTDGHDAHAHGDIPESPPSVYEDESVSSSPSPAPAAVVPTPGYDKAEQGIFGQVETKTKKTMPKEKERRMRTLPANTINFAQREKDEMRDLTRASEIMTFFPPSSPTSPSIPTPRPHDARAMRFEEELERDKEEISGSSTATFWDPTLGQIFLGNSNDVPMPVDDPVYSRRLARRVSSQSQSAHSAQSNDTGSEACSCSDEEEWDWSGNDPAQGFGYDICIECDDLAIRLTERIENQPTKIGCAFRTTSQLDGQHKLRVLRISHHR